MRQHTIIWFGIGATAVVAGALFLLQHPQPAPTGLTLHPTAFISTASTTIAIAIADTQGEREQGLSGISSLQPDQGMLFVFPKDGVYSFWMKDMLFPIDMLWLSADGQVVFVARSVSPDTYPRAFTPDTPGRYVLEVPTGFATEHEIGVGSKLHFSLEK